MPQRVPTPPKRTSKLASMLADIIQCLIERTPLTSDRVRITYTPNGFHITPTAKGGGASAPVQGMQWKGEWSSTRSYSAQDVVRVSSGPYAGTYVCIRSVTGGEIPVEPPADPTQGVYWAQLAGPNIVGIWS